MPNLYPAQPTSRKEMVNARIREYNNSINEATVLQEQKEEQETRKRNAIYEVMYKNRENQTSRYRKFTAFTERARDMLFEHTLYTLCSESLRKVDKARKTSIMESYDNNSALHAMIYKFIHENGGAAALLSKIRLNTNSTYYMDTIRQINESAFKAILESVDKDDPETLEIDPSITEKFKKDVASEDTDVMSDEISSRIVSAIGDFVEGNIKDKDAIAAALEKTKEKIDDIPDDREDLKESYVRLGKRFITDVRARKHGLFNEMVSMLSKEVVKNKALHEEYMDGTHVNVGKIVDKTILMYGFLETVNTMKLIDVTPEYIKEQVLHLD